VGADVVAAPPDSDTQRPSSRPSDLAVGLRLLAYVRPHWRIAAPLALTLVAEVGFDNLYPLGVKYLVDTAVGLGDATLFVTLLAALGVLFVIATSAGVGREHLSAALGARCTRDLRARLFEQLLHLSAGFYANREVGDLMARFSTDLAPVEHGIDRSLPHAVYSVLGVIVGVPLLFWLDWHLFLVTLVVLPISLLGPRLLGARATGQTYARKDLEGRLAGTIQEVLSGYHVIRAFGLEPSTRARFDRQLATLARASQRATFLQRLIVRTSYMGVMLGQMVIIGVGAYLVLQGTTTVGSLIGFIGVLIGLADAVRGVASSIPEWLQATAGMRRIEELLTVRPQISDAPDALALPPIQHAIRFDRVSFSYAGDRRALADVSLTILAGQRVAVVGRSGSGKSSIFNLLTRFYDPTDGSVSIDGHDLRRVTQASLRAQLGVVFQESFLFKGTIRENIALGKLGAMDAEVEDAARAAQIHDLVASWPHGYDTEVGERGAQLSGGQRQRVALARAILRDPAILLLDEATSALDPVTEAAFDETLATLAAGRTVVSVTHRLSGVVRADQIFVVDGGRLMEHGTHEMLLALGGTYAAMWRQQQEGLITSDDGISVEIAPASVEQRRSA
jgi:ATP-binding cassette subfamily B protein